MFKTLIAGATALSLTITPAAAQGFDEDQIGKIIFGLFATAAIAKIIESNKQPARQASTVTQPKPKAEHEVPVTRHPTRPRNTRNVLPQECVSVFQTNQGRVRMVTRRCIAQHYTHAANFPRNCERDVMTHQGFRTGWDVRCLRQNGFRADRWN